MGWVGNVTRNMAANFTTRNPLFIARNASRDYIFANTMLAVKENAKYAANLTKTYQRLWLHSQDRARRI